MTTDLLRVLVVGGRWSVRGPILAGWLRGIARVRVVCTALDEQIAHPRARQVMDEVACEAPVLLRELASVMEQPHDVVVAVDDAVAAALPTMPAPVVSAGLPSVDGLGFVSDDEDGTPEQAAHLRKLRLLAVHWVHRFLSERTGRPEIERDAWLVTDLDDAAAVERTVRELDRRVFEEPAEDYGSIGAFLFNRFPSAVDRIYVLSEAAARQGVIAPLAAHVDRVAAWHASPLHPGDRYYDEHSPAGAFGAHELVLRDAAFVPLYTRWLRALDGEHDGMGYRSLQALFETHGFNADTWPLVEAIVGEMDHPAACDIIDEWALPNGLAAWIRRSGKIDALLRAVSRRWRAGDLEAIRQMKPAPERQRLMAGEFDRVLFGLERLRFYVERVCGDDPSEVRRLLSAYVDTCLFLNR